MPVKYSRAHDRHSGGKGTGSAYPRDLSKIPPNADILSTIMDHANEAVVITQDGIIQAANKRAIEITGWTLEKLCSAPFIEFVHPDDQEMVMNRYFMRLAGREPEEKFYIFRLIDGNGDSRYLETTGTSITLNGRPAGLHFMTEVTRRLQAEAQIRASEAQYRYLVEHASDAIAIVQDRGIRYINQAAFAMMGYTLAELEGMDVLDLVHPDYQEQLLEIHRKRLHGEAVPNPYNFDALSKQGKRIHAQVTAADIEWEGRPALMTLVRDVTESRKLEEQLQQAQRMEAMGTLAGGVAHDFNNLLMAIQGHASLMLLGASPESSHYGSLKSIEECVRSGAELTRQLLGYAKGGKYEVRPRNINQIIEGTSAMFGRTKKEVRIHEDLAQDLWPADVDQAQIEQVLLNIFVNAWHAMDRGGDLFIKTQNTILSGHQATTLGIKGGKYVKIAITDTGVGMDELTRKRIFEPFFSTKEMGHGTGLGLASAYGIIKSHGGLIHVYSEKGKGATFTIYLQASEKTAESAPWVSHILHKGQGLILLADDEQMIREVGSRMLEELGYEVITASNGEEAARLFQESPSDVELVILDVIMPGLDVMEALERIRARAPEAKVLLSSGYSVDGQARSLMEKGCNGFIQKPFDIVELSGKIRAICRS